MYSRTGLAEPMKEGVNTPSVGIQRGFPKVFICQIWSNRSLLVFTVLTKKVTSFSRWFKSEEIKVQRFTPDKCQIHQKLLEDFDSRN